MRTITSFGWVLRKNMFIDIGLVSPFDVGMLVLLYLV